MTAVETARQVEGLRVAAARLGGPVGAIEAVTLPVYDGSGSAGLLEAPGVVARPMAAVLLAAADRIEACGSALGLPVNYALEIAGAILGQDLGHNR